MGTRSGRLGGLNRRWMAVGFAMLLFAAAPAVSDDTATPLNSGLAPPPAPTTAPADPAPVADTAPTAALGADSTAPASAAGDPAPAVVAATAAPGSGASA